MFREEDCQGKTDELMSTVSSWFVSVVMTEAGPASLSPRASFDVTTDQVPVWPRRGSGSKLAPSFACFMHMGKAGLQGPAGEQLEISKMLWIHQG